MCWASLRQFRCFLLLLLLAMPAIADDPLARSPPHLQLLVSGKMDLKDGQPRLVLMVDSFRQERIRMETTRRVVRIDGIDEATGEEQITVLDGPKTDKREIVRRHPIGLKPTVVDLKDVKFFDLNWTAVTTEQASEKLKQLGPLFLLDGGRRAGRFSPSQLRALNPDCLILVTTKKIRQDAKARANPFGGGDPFGGAQADPFGP